MKSQKIQNLLLNSKSRQSFNECELRRTTGVVGSTDFENRSEKFLSEKKNNHHLKNGIYAQDRLPQNESPHNLADDPRSVLNCITKVCVIICSSALAAFWKFYRVQRHIIIIDRFFKQTRSPLETKQYHDIDVKTSVLYAGCNRNFYFFFFLNLLR